PRCTFSACTPGRSASSPPQGHFVFGHEPKPAEPRLYGSSWVAAKRLGSAESCVSVSTPRSTRNASASSSVSSFRSEVSRQSCSRFWRSSATELTRASVAMAQHPSDQESDACASCHPSPRIPPARADRDRHHRPKGYRPRLRESATTPRCALPECYTSAGQIDSCRGGGGGEANQTL